MEKESESGSNYMDGEILTDDEKKKNKATFRRKKEN